MIDFHGSGVFVISSFHLVVCIPKKYIYILNLVIDSVIVGILVSLSVEFFIFGFPFFYHVEFFWTLDENLLVV